jgi:hypothetical protein
VAFFYAQTEGFVGLVAHCFVKVTLHTGADILLYQQIIVGLWEGAVCEKYIDQFSLGIGPNQATREARVPKTTLGC